MKKLIVGNWKLNPASLVEAENLTTNYSLPTTNSLEVALLPPFVFLEDLVKKFPQFKWGVQDFSLDESGEISLPILKSLGVGYVLVGHSDRRYPPAGGGETDEIVNAKLLAALEERFNVILAVGEREKGTESRVIESLKASTKGVKETDKARLVVAYEPVWAISTTPGAESDTPEHASAVIAELRKALDVRCLYGGSVNSANIAGFLSQPNVSGALVGGASLKAEEFSKILEIASQL